VHFLAVKGNGQGVDRRNHSGMSKLADSDQLQQHPAKIVFQFVAAQVVKIGRDRQDALQALQIALKGNQVAIALECQPHRGVQLL